jgi:pSer/pThr/pTyr-binding forkhead associated (FHA) protein
MMQTCSNCKSKQFDGTIFCSECGASLIHTRHNETTVSLGQPDPTSEIDDPEPMFVPAPTPPDVPTLTLVIMNSGRQIKLAVGDDLLIGRKDNARGIFPDVDLGLDGGYDAGVSRRHAILSHKDGVYQIEDLGSANGTFVNDRRLAPQAAMPLANGDELKCGTLLMRVEFS